ncbi:hypothetical protein E2C01_091749 [Portunus trituberculatus]|uniref:Uncharacterized protein n=1 Tax=Portunus trituberculatus TaxID=210409 RepID=A0A5B7JTP0_PORTR|nr:hypothetical protein [Portunus trituberculatus]
MLGVDWEGKSGELQRLREARSWRSKSGGGLLFGISGDLFPLLWHNKTPSPSLPPKGRCEAKSLPHSASTVHTRPSLLA